MKTYLRFLLAFIMFFTLSMPPSILPTSVPSVLASDLQELIKDNGLESQENGESKSNSLSTSHEKVELKVGESTNVFIFSGNSKNREDVTKKVSWEIQKKGIVSIKDGKITAKSAGSTIVTAKYRGQALKIDSRVSPKQNSPSVKIRENDGSVVLTWGTVDAHKYVVKRGTSSKKLEVLSLDIKDNTFTDNSIDTNVTFPKMRFLPEPIRAWMYKLTRQVLTTSNY